MQKKREYKLHEKQIFNNKNQILELKHIVKEQQVKKEEIENSMKKMGKEVEAVLETEKLKIIDFDEMEVKDENIQNQIKKLNDEFNTKLFEQKQLNTKE